jgi:hypothetical protein
MINYTKRVYVYWNLRRKVWSVAQSARVVDHAGSLSLRECKFLVGTKGRDRVRREGKKNVHAGVSGYLYKDAATVYRMARDDMYDWDQIWVMYNPYKHDTFIQRTGVCDDKYPRPVYGAEYVFMDMEIELDIPRVMALEPKRERNRA